MVSEQQGNRNDDLVRMLPQEISKNTLEDWHDSAAEYVRTELLKKKQFVDDEELLTGGTIQKLVCMHINISGKERARVYWEENGGKQIVRNTFRKKRQSAQNAMKLAFRGKKKCNGCFIVGLYLMSLLLNQLNI